MKYYFVPDICKIEESFTIEASNEKEALEKLAEEFPYNCLLTFARVENGIIYILGVVEICEGQKPHYLSPFEEGENE